MASTAWNVSRDTRDWAATRDRVFLVADRLDDGERLANDLAAGAELPASLVGFLPLDEVRGAGTDPIVSRSARAAGATIVVLDTAAQAEPAVVEQAASLHRQGIRIRTLALFYEEWLGKLPHTELARVSLLFDVGELHRARYVRARRIVDLAFAAIGLVALVPLVVVVTMLNPLLNRGPLFFRQDRVGRGGQIFEMWKLRTMVAATPSAAAPSAAVEPAVGIAGSDPGMTTAGTWTTTGDARVTPLGGLLRRSHLDELPQVINILRGDLSLVGPRPEQPHYVEQLREKVAFYELRHIVRPGLTGWAQVKQGYASDTDGAFEKLQYDFYYLRRQGLGLDARIVWRTVRGVVRGDGR